MLQVSTERLTPIPFVFSANVTGDAEPPDKDTGDPEVPGARNKPPDGSQPAPADTEDGPGSSSRAPADDDIIIKGG